MPPHLKEAMNCKTNGKLKYYDRKAIFLKKMFESKNEGNNSSSNKTISIHNNEEFFINYNESNVMNNIVFLDQILLEVTQKCNLDCGYCIYGKYYEYDKTRKNKNLDVKIAKTLLDHILEIKIKNDVFNNITISFYGGEPLLNFSFIEEIVLYLKENYENMGFVFEYSMTTNGVFLLDKHKYLIENNFRLSVSLDGNTTNNQFRIFKNGNNSFHEVYNNLKFLSINFPEYFRDNVSILTVFHKLNDLGSLLLYFKEEFGKTPHISSIQTAGVKDTVKQDFFNTFFIQSDESKKDSLETILELKTKHPVFKRIKDILSKEIDIVSTDFNSFINGRKKTSNTHLPAGTCSPFELRLFLTVEGWILPCEHIDFRFRLGVCTPNKVRLNLNAIEKFYNSIHSQHRSICNICFFKENCSVCMLNMEYNSYGKPFCTEFKSEEDFIKYLSDAVNDMESFPEITDTILNE
jgi:uncharacterized protein